MLTRLLSCYNTAVLFVLLVKNYFRKLSLRRAVSTQKSSCLEGEEEEEGPAV